MSNPLTDVIPEQARKYLYALAFLGTTVFAIYQAADGDWKQFSGAVLGALVTLLATSNTGGSLIPGKKDEGGAITFDQVMALLVILTFVGVVLLLFRVHLNGG